jgi:hypothetical protein
MSSYVVFVAVSVDNSYITVDSIEWYDKQYFAIVVVEIHTTVTMMTMMMMREIERMVVVVTIMRGYYYHAVSWIDS